MIKSKERKGGHQLPIILLLLLFISSGMKAQEYYFINKKIVEQGSNTPIPFVNIMLVDRAEGTAADVNGNFQLKVTGAMKNEKLRFSCIGYIPLTIRVDSLLLQESNIIEIAPDISLLDEVIIRQAPIDPAEIIRMSIEEVKNNYDNKPFNMEFLSTILATQYLDSNTFELETVLFGYSEGYGNQQLKKFDIKERRSTGADFLQAHAYNYWPSFEVHNVDQIGSPNKQGIFNPKHLDKFQLKYVGASIFDTDTVYTIEYILSKPTKEITGFGIVPKLYQGSISITTNNYAIVQHEVKTDRFSYSILYKKINDYYYPYFISGDRAPNIPVMCKIKNTLTLQRIVTKDVQVISNKTNEFQDLTQIPFNAQYWNSHYPKN